MARNIFENDVISNSFNSMVGVVSKEIGAINNFENMSKQKFDTPKDYSDFLSKRLKKNNTNVF